MFSRRNFLLEFFCCGFACFAAVQAQQGSASSAGSVPPAIAALPDLSGQAKPFTNDERLGSHRAGSAVDGRQQDRRDHSFEQCDFVGLLCQYSIWWQRALLGAGDSGEGETVCRLSGV